MAYKNWVFLNVPFDRKYKPLLEAAVFVIYDCGFIARSAMEDDDGSVVRIEKLYRLISESKYGIHDISRVTLDTKNRLPRFNMPLELGLFLGAKRFGVAKDKKKRALVLDITEYRYQKFCSDIAGQDIRAHKNNTTVLIRKIRNWLRSSPHLKGLIVPSPETIAKRYRKFQKDLPTLCRPYGLSSNSLEFNDYSTLVGGWLKANPK